MVSLCFLSLTGIYQLLNQPMPLSIWKWRTSQLRAMRKFRLLIPFQFHQSHSQKKPRISHEIPLIRWTPVAMHEEPRQPTTPARCLLITKWKWRTSQPRAMRKFRLLILFQFHQNHSQKKLRISLKMPLRTWISVAMHEVPRQVPYLLEVIHRFIHRGALKHTTTASSSSNSSSNSSQCVLIYLWTLMSGWTEILKNVCLINK